MRRRHRASVPLPCRLSAAPRAHRPDRGALRARALLRRRPAGRRAIRCRRRSGGSPPSAPTRRPPLGRASRSRSIDSGVDPTSPEFAGRPNTTFLNSQTVDGPGEYHGTAVASLAVAAANGVGIVGVYPQAAFQSFDASPVGQITDMTAAQGIVAAAQHCPGVISISFGGTKQRPDSSSTRFSMRVHNGCLIVAAAGNGGLEGNPPTYPATYPHVLSVGATDQNDAVAAFSTLSPDARRRRRPASG